MHKPVQDGIGQCRVRENLVPVLHRNLRGHQRRASAVAVIKDLERVAAPLVGEGCNPPVIQNQQITAGDGRKLARIRP